MPEVGVGLGADHECYARTGANLHGIELSARAVELTSGRLALQGLSSNLSVSDAEALPFADRSFDLVSLGESSTIVRTRQSPRRRSFVSLGQAGVSA
jgi:ubiquinone/menaquinone biosynthesis C-methylase UbiE